MPSKQLTTVPFISLFTGLTTILDIGGELPLPESLEKVIVEEVTIVSGGGTRRLDAVMGVVVWVIFSGKTVNSHLWFTSISALVLIHVSSN